MILRALKKANRKAELQRLPENKAEAAILNKPPRDDIGLVGILGGKLDAAIRKKAGAPLLAEASPHGILGEIRRGGDPDKAPDPLGSRARHKKGYPAAHGGANQNLGTLGQGANNVKGVLSPVANAAVQKITPGKAMAGIVKAKERAARGNSPLAKMKSLVTLHVRAEAAHENNAGTRAANAVIGDPAAMPGVQKISHANSSLKPGRGKGRIQQKPLDRKRRKDYKRPSETGRFVGARQRRRPVAEITLTFPDGAKREFPRGVTPAQVAASIAKSLERKAISAHVNGEHWDLAWPLEADASIAINTLRDEGPALELIRHSLAHIMARAVQEIWPEVKATIGPVIKDGCFYDFDKPEPFVPEDLGTIEAKMREIIALGDPVRTEVWSRRDALEHYRSANQEYKAELVEAIPEGEDIRMYWHGHWQDLCRGPHLQSTGQVPPDAFKLMSIAGSYWRGDSSGKALQRIYCVAFKSREGLKAHLNMLEEAARRDHRKLGREMGLFHMQEEAPGQIFWHPSGWTMYTELQDYMRRRQRQGGYVEVNTPQVVSRKLWEESGHWEKYQEHMFIVEVDEEHAREKQINALKPMNCPCHVQIYNQGIKSYRDLPLRMAEFGSCNRYEPSGALHGLMRVRGFTQDDGHIFCEESQIESETATYIGFLAQIYRDLGFEDFRVKFADRPEQRAGSDSVWDRAEAALLGATRAAGIEPELNPGEGAFYGPKLEFVLTDAIGRDWQCGTHQVDFVLPERLGATYIGRDGNKHRPVMLHRAALGSFERFIGILIEQHAGKMPFWLAPRQVVVATIISGADAYAGEVAQKLRDAGVRAEADTRNEQINYKVREHSLSKVPYILAAGQREIEARSISVRKLGETITAERPLDEIVAELASLADPPDLAGESRHWEGVDQP